VVPRAVGHVHDAIDDDRAFPMDVTQRLVLPQDAAGCGIQSAQV